MLLFSRQIHFHSLFLANLAGIYTMSPRAFSISASDFASFPDFLGLNHRYPKLPQAPPASHNLPQASLKRPFPCFR